MICLQDVSMCELTLCRLLTVVVSVTVTLDLSFPVPELAIPLRILHVFAACSAGISQWLYAAVCNMHSVTSAVIYVNLSDSYQSCSFPYFIYQTIVYNLLTQQLIPTHHSQCTLHFIVICTMHERCWPGAQVI